jgi:hypothetical protein
MKKLPGYLCEKITCLTDDNQMKWWWDEDSRMWKCTFEKQVYFLANRAVVWAVGINGVAYGLPSFFGFLFPKASKLVRAVRKSSERFTEV